MDIVSFLNSDAYTWIILPILIFFARILDVSLGTIRVIFVSKGFKYIAPFIGFFEVIIWLLAIGQIMKNMDNILCYIAYGAGFGTGTFIGIYLEEKMSIGLIVLRLIVSKNVNELISYFKTEKYGFTVLSGDGAFGPVTVFFVIIQRRFLKRSISSIKKIDPNIFYSIQDIKAANEGIFKNDNQDTLSNKIYKFLKV